MVQYILDGIKSGALVLSRIHFLLFFSSHNVLAAPTTIYIRKHHNYRNILQSHAAILLQTDLAFAGTNTESDNRSIFTWSESIHFPETAKWTRSLSLVSKILALDVVHIFSFSCFVCVDMLNNKMHKPHSEHSCSSGLAKMASVLPAP